MKPTAQLLGRTTLSADEIMRAHPPRWSDRNKKALFAHVCPPGTVHAGSITVARWGTRPLPLTARWGENPLEGELRADVFDYAPRSDRRPGVEWHLNFAHANLFLAYGGPLLAQDELQVVEHPALAAVRLRLLADPQPGLQPMTRDGDDATPVLIRGVERRCALDTRTLYGNAFSRARIEDVVAATRVLRPPTLSNILAMEAPIGGSGRYRTAQIVEALTTAYSGFSAATEESRAATGVRDPEVVIHTGHWGTGAYGGHRVLMATLQFIAARLAGVSRLVFHTVDEAGTAPCHTAIERLAPLAGRDVGATIAAIEAMNFMWGAPNGT